MENDNKTEEIYDFEYKNDKLKCFELNEKKIKTNEDIKAINDNKTANPPQNNLKDFISNLNRFNFSSAFDHKGAKSFLKSKGKALKEICIDDNLSDKEQEQKKEEKEKHKIASCKGFNKYITKQLKKEMISYKTKIKSTKNLHLLHNHTYADHSKEKKKSKKNKFKKVVSSKENDYIHINTFLKKDFKNISKTPLKFQSQIELKMFNDKSLNKLKPIRGKSINDNLEDNRVDTFTINHNEYFPFLKSDTSKTDSTLFNIVSEIKNL
jgi:uncharacterized protein YifE (UPF0438 family)